MGTFIAFNFTRVRNEEYPSFSINVADTVLLHNPEDLHLSGILQYVVDANGELQLRIIYDKMMSQTPVVMDSLDQIKRIVGSVLDMATGHKKANNPALAADWATTEPFINMYVKNIIGGVISAQITHLRDLYARYDADPALKVSVEKLLMKYSIEELRVHYNNLKDFSFERSLEFSDRGFNNFADLRKTSEKAIRNMLRSVVSYKAEYPALDYSQLIFNINSILTEQKAKADARATRRENASDKQQALTLEPTVKTEEDHLSLEGLLNKEVPFLN